MKAKTEREYEISGQDVREAILAWLRSKEMPVPQYIGDTPTCHYVHHDGGGVTIKWTDEGEVDRL